MNRKPHVPITMKNVSAHQPSGDYRTVGANSDKIGQSADAQQKQLRRAMEKRARKAAVLLEAAERGQIERSVEQLKDDAPMFSPALQLILDARAAAKYADEELRCDPEQEISHLRPDQ